MGRGPTPKEIKSFNLATGNTDKKIAVDLLKKNELDEQKAVQEYKDKGFKVVDTPSSTTTPASSVDTFYSNYKDKAGEFISQEGMVALFKDLSWALDDPMVIVFSYLCGAKKYGLYSKEEFLEGCKKLSVTSVEHLKSKKAHMKTTYLDN
jgi:hypothetical protein